MKRILILVLMTVLFIAGCSAPALQLENPLRLLQLLL